MPTSVLARFDIWPGWDWRRRTRSLGWWRRRTAQGESGATRCGGGTGGGTTAGGDYDTGGVGDGRRDQGIPCGDRNLCDNLGSEAGNAPSSLQRTILQVHGSKLAGGLPGGFLAGAGPAPRRLLAVEILHTTEAQSYRCIFPTLQFGPAGRGPLLAPANWTGAPPCIRPGPFFGPARSRLGPTRIQFQIGIFWAPAATGIRRRRRRRAALPTRSVPSFGRPFAPSRSPPPLHAAAAAAPLLPAPAPASRPAAVGAQAGSGVFVDDAIRVRPA